MKSLTKIFLALLLGVTLSHAVAFSKDAKFRSTQVHITANKPLTTGSNTLKFTITKNGKPLKDIKVALKAFMPAMPGMPAMSSKTNAKSLSDGVYEGTLNLAMSGTWQLHIFITPKEGRKSRIKTTLNF